MQTVRNFIKNSCSFNFLISNLLLIATIVFLIITYYMLQNSLNISNIRAHTRASVIENGIYYPINNAYQIMTNITEILAEEKIEKDNNNTFRLLNNFDSKSSLDVATPFSSFKLLNSDDIIVMQTAIPSILFIPWKSLEDHALLEAVKKDSSELMVGPIRFSMLNKEEILPICMGIKSNYTSLYKGAICSGLRVNTLNHHLNSSCSSKYLNNIRILNKNSVDAQVPHHKVNNIFTIFNVLKYYWKDKEMIVHLPLKDYPILIQVKVNLYYIAKELGQIILYSINYFMLFIGVIYCLFYINRKFYRELFFLLQRLVNELPSNDTQAIIIPINNTKFNMECFASVMNAIIDHYNSLYLDAQKQKCTHLPLELQNNILPLLLADRLANFNKANISNRLSALYLSQLKKLINEDYIIIGLPEFLNDITEYCQKYHHNLKIKKILSKKDYKNFVFKHAALTEAIFHIFTLITRIGDINVKKQEVIIRGSFVDNNVFPTISIEIMFLDSLFKSLGWTLGPSYVYTGFLSIYALAKDNNLLFHIEQTSKKIIFILEPLDHYNLDEIKKKSLPVD